jgi:putative transposase
MDGLNCGKPGFTHDRSSVHKLCYHFLWTTRYKKPVLAGAVVDFLRETILEIAKDKGFDIHQITILKDHIHVMVTSKPKIAPSFVVKMLKGISARKILLSFPDVKDSVGSEKLWSPSTLIETIGGGSDDEASDYIKKQKNKGFV